MKQGKYYILLTVILCCISGISFAQEKVTIEKIYIDGNKITKKHIILRELEVHEGDTVDVNLLDEYIDKSLENLANLGIFNFQDIYIIRPDDTDKVRLFVQVTERWYVFPSPYAAVADRNLTAWYNRGKDRWRHLNYGFWLFWNNFRGRAETIDFLFKTGFDQHYQLTYKVPYLNRRKTLGITTGLLYVRSHQTNAITLNNKDIFYPYPIRREEFAKKLKEVFTQFVYRKDIHTRHIWQVSYSDYHFSDSLLILNPYFSFAGNTQNRFFGLMYMIKHDFRNYIHYPLKGYYIDFMIRRRGFGLGNFRFEDGSTEVAFNIRKYIPLSGKFYFATGFQAFHSLKRNTPYFYSPELGDMRSLIRGYENFTVRGQSFAIVRNNLKYELLPSTTFLVKGIREEFGKVHYSLYLNLFADAGYMKDAFFPLENTMGDRLLLGGGIGLDLLTYYDKVLRLEFSYHHFGGGFGFHVHYIPSI